MQEYRESNANLPNIHRDVSPERVSAVAENYLLVLYILREEELKLTFGHLAEYLKQLPETEGVGTSLPSVTSMVRRMVKEGLLSLTPEKEIVLTEKGDQLAASLVRRHRLAECLLIEMLGVEPSTTEVEAHRLEHAISPALESKIAERLGNPTKCPFGWPIPGSGYVPLGDSISLANARPGITYEVDRVPKWNQDLLRFLVENRMMPEARLVVLEAAAYRGVLSVDVSGTTVALGYDTAAHIWVRHAEK